MKQSLTLIAMIFFTVLFFVTNLLFTPVNLENVHFRIKTGEAAVSISRRLSDENIICSNSIFYYYARLTNSSKNLSYGLYEFNGSHNIIDVLEKIKSGKVTLRKITIPEGLTITKTCMKLAEENFGKLEKFIELCNSPKYAKQLTGFDINSLEGFLYPETYNFPETATEDYIIKTMVNIYFSQTKELDFSTVKLDYYNILIIASIVEMEAKVQTEKSKIASVYLNRFRIGMKLQADPTIVYFLEKMGKKRKKVYYKDLEIKSPYNTYLNNGLPPSPICSPSKSAIAAVLNPLKTDYLFFFAGENGEHIFSQTYRQHLAKQRK